MGGKPRTRGDAALALVRSEAGQAFIAQRVDELEVEIADLQKRRDAYLSLLDPNIAPASAGAALAQATRRQKRSKRRGVSKERVLETLQESSEPMLRRELERTLGANSRRVKAALEDLVAGGLVEKVGRGRGTRYQA